MSIMYKSIVLVFPLLVFNLLADDFPKPAPLAAHVPIEHESNELHPVTTLLKKEALVQEEHKMVHETSTSHKEVTEHSQDSKEPLEEDEMMPLLSHSKEVSVEGLHQELKNHNDEVKESYPVRAQLPSLPDEHGHVMSGVGFENEVDEEKLLHESQFDTAHTKGSGNWVYKNYWWRKIEELYDQIKEVFNKIMSFRIIFFKERSDADKKLDNFYQKVGMDQGALDTFFTTGLEIIEKEKKDQGYLTKKEREFLDRIKEKQRQLDQLREDIKAIMAVDRKIDDALDVVAEQISACNNYEQHAWEIFKSIARELNDKEARRQYYEVEALLKDIENVDTYLRGAFKDYFEKLHSAIDDHTQKILSQIAALKHDGIDIVKEAKLLEQEEITHQVMQEEEKKRDQEIIDVDPEYSTTPEKAPQIEEQKKEMTEKVNEPVKQQPKKIKTTFTQRMYGWLKSFGAAIGSFFRAIMGDTAVDYLVDALILA